MNIILLAAVLLPAFIDEDIIKPIAIIIVMLLNPLPTVSESVIVVASAISAYAGAVYLVKRAVDYLSKN